MFCALIIQRIKRTLLLKKITEEFGDNPIDPRELIQQYNRSKVIVDKSSIKYQVFYANHDYLQTVVHKFGVIIKKTEKR